jgi:hypothetical protein
MKKSPALKPGFVVSGSSASLSSNIFAAKVNTLLKHVIHTTRVDTIRRGNVVLILALPMAEPDINSVIKSETVRFGFRIVPIKHRSILIFESAFGNVDSASTVRESAQVLADSAATSPKAFAVKWEAAPAKGGFSIMRRMIRDTHVL